MKGLYKKYNISKANGSATDPDAIYIVLRIDKGEYVEACRAGVVEFALAVDAMNHQLAQDLVDLVKRLVDSSPDDDANPGGWNETRSEGEPVNEADTLERSN
jgi:hypothetical protein